MIGFNKVRLSLCMIVKNEASCLAGCLRSVQGLVDEIIIVDTGSTDGTKDIAASFGAKAVDFVWQDDFSAARNESLKHATGDWILVLDADEVISSKDHTSIREAMTSSSFEASDISETSASSETSDTSKTSETSRVSDNSKNSRIIAYRLVQRNYTDDFSLANWVSSQNDSYEESKCAHGWDPNPIFRLFRNGKGIFFEGRVHECVDKSVARLLSGGLSSGSLPLGSLSPRILSSGGLASGCKWADLTIPIHHLGYAGLAGSAGSAKRKEKLLFYKGLAEKAVRENPLNTKAKLELASCHYDSGNFKEALCCLQEALKIDQLFHQARVMEGTCHLQLQQFDEAKAVFQKCLAEGVRTSEVYGGLGLICIAEKNHQDAIDFFIKAIERNPTNASYHYNIAQLFQMIGEMEKAYRAAMNAVALNPVYRRFVELEGSGDEKK